MLQIDRLLLSHRVRAIRASNAPLVDHRCCDAHAGKVTTIPRQPRVLYQMPAAKFGVWDHGIRFHEGMEKCFQNKFNQGEHFMKTVNENAPKLP